MNSADTKACILGGCVAAVAIAALACGHNGAVIIGSMTSITALAGIKLASFIKK